MPVPRSLSPEPVSAPAATAEASGMP